QFTLTRIGPGQRTAAGRFQHHGAAGPAAAGLGQPVWPVFLQVVEVFDAVAEREPHALVTMRCRATVRLVAVVAARLVPVPAVAVDRFVVVGQGRDGSDEAAEGEGQAQGSCGHGAVLPYGWPPGPLAPVADTTAVRVRRAFPAAAAVATGTPLPQRGVPARVTRQLRAHSPRS